MRRRTSIAVTLALVAAALAPASALAAARAELRPGPELAVGQPAQLTVTIDGAGDQPPPVRIDGATVRYSGQASRITVINGQQLDETSYVYTIVPTHTGSLDIPAITMSTPSGIQSTSPIHATVTDTPAAPARAPRADAADGARANEPSRAFLKLELPSKALYVGQAVPVKIRAYFRAGTAVTLQGAPHLTSDAFTLSELTDKPAQTQVVLQGVPYLQATWTAVLSPAKPSTGKLAVELPVELAYREAPRARPHRSMRELLDRDPFGGDPSGADPSGADPFGGDPFADMDALMDRDAFADLDSMFATGPMQQRQLTLKADAGKITVGDVPSAGQPAGFTGAVGTFALAIDPPAEEPRVGEPLTLTVHATGTGNFDRVSVAGVTTSAALKTYPVKSTFAPSAGGKLAGTKTFTQTIIPTKAGPLELPPITLTYFDPIKRAYVTAEVTPPSLVIAGARGGGAASPGLATASVRDTAMAPNRVDPGTPQASLQPKFRQREFWMLPAAIALFTALASCAAWWRRSPRVAKALQARRIDREIARAKALMVRAADHDDRAAFFTAARTALQSRLGAAWRMSPDAITAADVAARLGDRGTAIRAVFEHADRVTYARDLTTAEPLAHWHAVVRDELTSLETSR